MNFKILKYDERYEIIQILEYSPDKSLDETYGKRYGARFSYSFDTIKELIKNAHPVNYYSFSGIQYRLKETEAVLDFTCDSWREIPKLFEKYPEVLI